MKSRSLSFGHIYNLAMGGAFPGREQLRWGPKPEGLSSIGGGRSSAAYLVALCGRSVHGHQEPIRVQRGLFSSKPNQNILLLGLHYA